MTSRSVSGGTQSCSPDGAHPARYFEFRAVVVGRAREIGAQVVVTASTGNAALNQQLSEKCATAVINYMAQRGRVPLFRILNSVSHSTRCR